MAATVRTLPGENREEGGAASTDGFETSTAGAADATRPAAGMSDAAPDGTAAPFLVVGVGASAGGLEAFGELVEALPPRPGMAFVLVQHLAPDSASSLASLLGRRTALPVSEVD